MHLPLWLLARFTYIMSMFKKICKDQQDKQNAFNADIEAFTQETSARANALIDQLQLQLDGETDDEEDSLDVAIV